MNILLILLLSVALVHSTNLRTHSHFVSAEVSKQTADSIKTKLLSALPLIKNQATAALLLKDLNETDDSKRLLKTVDTQTASDIFAIFGMRLPEGSDQNKDGILTGDELKCFNKIWQSFVVPKHH